MKIWPKVHIHAKFQEFWWLFDEISGKKRIWTQTMTLKSVILGHIQLKFS